MRLILMGDACRRCGATVALDDDPCPHCAADQPLATRAWHVAAIALALVAGALFAAPGWLHDLVGR
jgi:hypothetical protein